MNRNTIIKVQDNFINLSQIVSISRFGKTPVENFDFFIMLNGHHSIKITSIFEDEIKKLREDIVEKWRIYHTSNIIEL